MNADPRAVENENAPLLDGHRHRFTTPLRRAFKRLRITRKRQSSGTSVAEVENLLTERSNNVNPAFERNGLQPPPAPRPSRWATPQQPASPASPLPSMGSKSSCMLTDRSGSVNHSNSCGSLQAFVGAASSPPPPPALPRGDLFQLGLTPVQSIISNNSLGSNTVSDEPLFAPALLTAQRVSKINLTRETSDMDMIEMTDLPQPGELTPTPSRTHSTPWLPTLPMQRRSAHNTSTTAVFDSGDQAQPRRTSFMSRLVGSAWGLTGIGFTSMHASHRAQSTVALSRPTERVFTPLPTISLGKGSMEQAVLGRAFTSQLGLTPNSSRGHVSASDLPPANSILRTTGTKSARELDYLEEDHVSHAGSLGEVKMEQRPKKKRRSDVNKTVYESVSSSAARVTRSMSTHQAHDNTPTRVTRSTSKRLAQASNSPAKVSYGNLARRPKNLKRV